MNPSSLRPFLKNINFSVSSEVFKPSNLQKIGIMRGGTGEHTVTFPFSGSSIFSLNRPGRSLHNFIPNRGLSYHTKNSDNTDRHKTITKKVIPLHASRVSLALGFDQIRVKLEGILSSLENPESQNEINSKIPEEEQGLAGTEIRDFIAEHKRKLIENNPHLTKQEEKRQLVSLGISQTPSLTIARGFVNSHFTEKPTEKERGIITDLIFDDHHSFDDIQDKNKKLVEQALSFNTHINNIMKETDNKKKINLLLSLMDNGVRLENGNTITGMERFNSFELKTIFTNLWELNAHDQMVEMMDNCENKHFTSNPLNIIFYARAILKGHYFNIHNANAVADFLIKDPETHIDGLTIKGIIEAKSRKVAKELLDCLESGSTDDLENKREDYVELFPEADTDIDTVRESYQNSLSSAFDYFKQAFLETYDCRLGCRAMHYLLEQNLTDEANNMAKLVQLAALKEGGLQSSNLAVARAYLEALYVLPESDPNEIKFAQDIVFTLCKTENQTTNILEGISTLEINSDPHYALRKSFVQDLSSHYYKLEKNPEDSQINIQRVKNELKQSECEWEQSTFNYKGLNSNHIDGNFKFGAQLPSHNINRNDRKFFEEVAKTPLNLLFHSESQGYGPDDSLLDVETFEEFNTLVNAFIRREFHTDEWDLEQLDSPGHKKYDTSVEALIALSGAPTRDDRKLIIDSRTNISANLILGLGDCRHHSQVKQILFDIWHGHQLTEVLEEINEAMHQGDRVKVEVLEDKFNSINSNQLQTIDCEVYLPIEMDKGVPVIHNGHFVKNLTGIPEKVEEHTLNLKTERYLKSNQLKSIHLTDGFYQRTYPWANCPIDIEKQKLKDGIEAGVVEVYDPKTGTLEAMSVVIKPANYAGTRDLYDRANNDKVFIGRPVEFPSFNEARQQKMVDNRNRFLENLCNWHKNIP